MGGTSIHNAGYGATIETNQASADLLLVKDPGGVSTEGPTIENINFAETDGTRTDKLLHLNNIQRWHTRGVTFHSGAYGEYIEGATDCSDSTDIDNGYLNNVVGYFVGGGNCASQNILAHSYIKMMNANDIGIQCAYGGGSFRIVGNRIDSSSLSSYPTIGVQTSCNMTQILGNTFEGGVSPFIKNIQDGGATSMGRSMTASGNQFVITGTVVAATLTCSPSNASTTMNCTTNPITAGVKAGMEVGDATSGHQTAFQQYTWSATTSTGANQLSVINNYVVSVSPSSVTLSEPPLLSETNDSINFMYPGFAYPTTPFWPITHVGNNYQNMASQAWAGFTVAGCCTAPLDGQ
jgi:hypothetical protein